MLNTPDTKCWVALPRDSVVQKATKIPFVFYSLILCALFVCCALFFVSSFVFLNFIRLLREWIEPKTKSKTKTQFMRIPAYIAFFWMELKLTLGAPFSPFTVIKVRMNLPNLLLKDHEQLFAAFSTANALNLDSYVSERERQLYQCIGKLISKLTT